MKFRSTLIVLATLSLTLATRVAIAGDLTNEIAQARGLYQADRQQFISQALQLTDKESAAFWPLYESYRADIESIGDGIVKLVLEYADVYPDVPEDRAQKLLKDYLALEEKLVAKRAHYVKKAAKAISATKALRWAQLENRLDLPLRLQLAAQVPAVPATRPKSEK